MSEAKSRPRKTPDVLRKLREQRGISQLELACTLDFSQQLVSKWELGTSKLNIDAVQALADFYGVSTDYIFGRETDAETQMRGLLAHMTPEQVAQLCEIALGMISGAEETEG